MKIKHTFIWSFLFVLIFALSACDGEKKKTAEKKVIRPVKVRVIGEGELTNSNNSFSGTAKGIRESVLSFRVSGSLKSLDFDEGQNVKAGQTAARLDENDFKISIQGLENQYKGAIAQLTQLSAGARKEDIQILESKLKSANAAVRSAESSIRSAESAVISAKTAFEAAQSEHKRVNQLYAKQASSKRDLDNAQSNLELKRSQWEQSKSQEVQVKDQLIQAKQNVETAMKELEKGKAGGRQEEILAQEAQVKALQSNLEQARVNLAYTHMKIPFDGIISKKHVSNFEQINAGSQVYTLIDVNEIEVQISVPDTMISQIHQGQEVAINFLSLPGRNFKGVIHKIAITADVQTLTYPVFVKIANKGALIRPGMTANVEFQVENQSTYPTVQIHSILQDKVTQEKYVWLFEKGQEKAQGKAKRQNIVIGTLLGEEVEVIKGLKNGDILITAGIHKLREDMDIRLVRPVQ